MCTYVCDINSSDTTAAIVAYSFNHFIENFARVSFSTNRHFKPMHPTLGVFPCGALNSDIWASSAADVF